MLDVIVPKTGGHGSLGSSIGAMECFPSNRHASDGIALEAVRGIHTHDAIWSLGISRLQEVTGGENS